MTRCIALLRAVNVGGRNLIAMADLRAFLERLGLTNPATLLQSGNAVFGAGKRSPDALESLLEKEAARSLGLKVDFLVRTVDEWDAALAANPFANEARETPAKVAVMALKDAPGTDRVEALRAAIRGPERIAAEGRHLYIHYPDGQGRSTLTGALIEKTLSTRGTARNWNTAQKLAVLAHK